MTPPHVVVGLDGADLSLIRQFGPDKLPILHNFMTQGCSSALRSVFPPATLPNWTTFLTGLDPAAHGVFDFTTRKGYRVRFEGGLGRTRPTILSRLDAVGKTCCSLGFPGTYPPEKLKNGLMISGWDSPVAFEADASFVHPTSLYTTLQQRFGTMQFDDVDEFAADSPGWHDALPSALKARIERKTELALYLMESRNWDLFAVYFGESDTAAHYLYSYSDIESPRHPQNTTKEQNEALLSIYQALDRALGRIADAASPNTEWTIVSDHGSGGSSDKVLYLNRILAEGGFLSFGSTTGFDFRQGLVSLFGTLISASKEVALTRLTPRMRQTLFKAWGGRLPSLLESRARFGAIDFGRTAAFSEELNYFPSICWNIKGREPQGTVSPKDIPSLQRELACYLREVRDPFNGQPVVKALHPREALFDGPHLEKAPDLFVELHLDKSEDRHDAQEETSGYSYNLMPSSTAPHGTGAFRRLAEDEYLGRKGRSLPGSHRPRGFLAMAGPSVESVGEIEAEIADATASLLHRMGVLVPQDASGRVLWEALTETTNNPGVQLPDAISSTDAKALPNQEAIFESRLRALGYID
ncbi:MAG: alkaline phosphatase family protein [Myxococcota bacterium]